MPGSRFTRQSQYSLAFTLAFILGFAPLATFVPAARAQSAAVCAVEAVVVQGDTLSSIATAQLGTPGAYPAIVEASNAAAALDGRFTAIQDPNTIAPGWRLCIRLGEAPSAATVATGEDGVDGGSAPAESVAPGPMSNTTATPDLATDDAVVNADADTESDVEDLPFGRPVIEGEPHPLSVEYLRAQSFPGSDIQIKQTLTPGSTYSRYLVSYLSEGLEIDAYMTVPFGATPPTGWPVVVFNHGYIPPEVYRSAERYIAYTDAFARADYIVFRPDYRGHGFSEGEARSGYGRPDYTIDVLNALASVRRYPAADAARVGMWGHSMGGYIALRAMIVDDQIKAGVIWAGVVASYPDLLEHWNRRRNSTRPRGGNWRETISEQYGTPEENPEFWASISSNTYVADLSGPVQLHHGTADSSVPFLFSQLLFDEIDAVDGNAQLYSYPGDDHNISANLYTALERSVGFFDEHVK